MISTMSHTTIPVQKMQIRDAAGGRRAETAVDEIKDRSQRICDPVLQTLDGSNPVMVYVSNLGYGAGYYDRSLSTHQKIPRIGLAFSCQEYASIPSDKNDIRMNLIITEEGVIRCGS
jgi:hypothetical protein